MFGQSTRMSQPTQIFCLESFSIYTITFLFQLYYQDDPYWGSPVLLRCVRAVRTQFLILHKMFKYLDFRAFRACDFMSASKLRKDSATRTEA